VIVDLFIPCYIDQFKPEIGLASKKMLEDCGFVVNYNPNQTCCGQVAFNAGFEKEAEEVATKFINDFSELRPVVMPSASCCSMVRNYYQQFFTNSASHHLHAQVKKNVFELAEFLMLQNKVSSLNAQSFDNVFVHASCSCRNEIQGERYFRTLMESVKGIRITNATCKTDCCGFGGTFSVKFPETSVELARQLCEEATESGAGVLVSSDYSCIMHLQSYIDAQQINLKAIHYSELFV
jgi:L-lactate dehydrogenase complex protein LldE